MNHNQLVTCANCGELITTYGPETFHTNTTLIRCANAEGTRATRKETPHEPQPHTTFGPGYVRGLRL